MPSGEVPRTGWVSAGMDISEGGATDRPSSQAHVQSVHVTQTVRKSRTVAVWLPTTCAAKAHQSCCVCAGDSWARGQHLTSHQCALIFHF